MPLPDSTQKTFSFYILVNQYDSQRTLASQIRSLAMPRLSIHGHKILYSCTNHMLSIIILSSPATLCHVQIRGHHLHFNLPLAIPTPT